MGLMRNLWQDLSFGLRLIHRTPLASTAAVLTYALGIGANVAVFSVAWPILGQALPFPEEDRLTHILLWIEADDGAGTNPISPGDYLDLLRAPSFDTLAGYSQLITPRNLSVGGEIRQLRVGSVTERFFDVLGVTPVLGRGLQASDFQSGTASLVLSESLWRRHFGERRDVIGQTIRLDGAPWTVIGVMPDHAALGTIDVEAWQAQVIDAATARQQRAYFLAMIGRLSDGVSLESANRDLRALMLDVADRHPGMNRLPGGIPVLARAESFRERLTGPVRPAFVLLIGGAALVLLVVVINLSGLQTARHLARGHELTVRRALGASRVRLVRQLLTEGLLVAAVGGAAGIGTAAVTLAGIRRVAPSVAWHEVSPALTLEVVIWTAGLTLLTGLAVSLVPTLAASHRTTLSPTTGRGGTAGRSAVRVRGAIISGQVALATVLLVAAALTGASLARVLMIDPGFDISSGLIADLRFVGSPSDRFAFFDTLVERVEALPGVERACAASAVPIDDDEGGMTFVAEGDTFADRRNAVSLGVTTGCFDALRMRLVAGRPFVRREATPVVIVSASMARALWPDASSAIGRRVHLGLETGPLHEVIGVVTDIRASALESDTTPQVWFPASAPWPTLQRLIVRGLVPPEALGTAVRSVLADLDPDLALANLRTMRDILDAATASRRFVLSLLGGFAIIALALCAVGIHGVLAHQVGQRTTEIGIRLALGARTDHVLSAVARPLVLAVAAGLTAGLTAAWTLSSLLASQLYEMSATDGRIYAAVAAFVVVTAAVAAAPPARRALRIPPGAVLRE